MRGKVGLCPLHSWEVLQSSWQSGTWEANHQEVHVVSLESMLTAAQLWSHLLTLFAFKDHTGSLRCQIVSTGLTWRVRCANEHLGCWPSGQMWPTKATIANLWNVVVQQCIQCIRTGEQHMYDKGRELKNLKWCSLTQNDDAGQSWSEESLQFVPSGLLAIRQGEALYNFDLRVGSHMYSGFLGPAVGLQARSSKAQRCHSSNFSMNPLSSLLVRNDFVSMSMVHQFSVSLALTSDWLHLRGCQCNAHMDALPSQMWITVSSVLSNTGATCCDYSAKKNLCSYMHRLHICISLQRLAAIKLTAFFQESKENPKQIQFARSSLNTSVLGSLLGRLWALHGTGGLKQLGAGLKGLKGLNQWWTAEYGWILLDVILKYLCALKLLKNILKCLKFQLCSNGSLWLRDSRITGWPEGIREVMQCSIPLWEFCGLSRLL